MAWVSEMRRKPGAPKSWGRLLAAAALLVGLVGMGPALAGEPPPARTALSPSGDRSGVTPEAVLAQTDRGLTYEESQPASPVGPSASMLWASVRTAGSLALVLAVIGLGVVAVRRLGPRARWMGPGGDGPRVVARTYLGPKESLCVVRVGPEVLLLGVSSQQISMLCKLDPARTAPSPGGAWFGGAAEGVRAGGGGQEPGAFQRTLRHLAGEGEAGPIPSDVPAFEGRLHRIRAAWGLGNK